MKQIEMKDIKIDYDLLKKFPPEFLIMNLFFPLHINNSQLEIMVSDPENLDKISMIENFIQKKVVPQKADKEDIEKWHKYDLDIRVVITEDGPTCLFLTATNSFSCVCAKSPVPA